MSARPMLNNKRQRLMAEGIIDVIDALGMFESVTLHVNRDRLVSPEQGTDKSVHKRTRNKVRYAEEPSGMSARDVFPDPSRKGSSGPHIAVLTFDGPLYDACQDPDFRRDFMSRLAGVTSCYGCHLEFVGTNQVSVYPDDYGSAAAFAKRD